jgi:hypothetical protein
MIDLKYSLVVEATADPVFFGFYSPELEGFAGIGHSVEDCLYKAKVGNGGTHSSVTRAESANTCRKSESNRNRPK